MFGDQTQNPSTSIFGLLFCLILSLSVGTSTSLAQEPSTESFPEEGASSAEDDEEWETFEESDDELMSMSLEELMDIEVTSVSGSEESWWKSAAAVFVLTRSDIERAGHTTIMEALRMVPGVDVAQISASTYAISVRGYRERFANKLLVLVDGRTLYNDSYGGVDWDMLSVNIHDIDRIEVIRGPGSTLWGANAVNGVINIITRRASRDDGYHASVGGGNARTFLGVGSATLPVLDNGAVRFTLSNSVLDSLEEAAVGGNANDDLRSHRLLMRYDHDISDDLKVTLLSGHFDVDRGEPLRRVDLATPPFLLPFNQNTTWRGSYVLGRLEGMRDGQRSWSLQAYWDKNRTRSDGVYEEQTFDIEFRQHLEFGQHQIIWGTGVRRREDLLSTTGTLLSFNPPRAETEKFNIFIQDSFGLFDDRLRVVLGTKVEKNDYSGVEWQPSCRLSAPINDSWFVWSAVSRAVHTPVRSDEGVNITLAAVPPPTVPSTTAVTLVGNQNLDAENLIAYELGTRYRFSASSYLDVAAFYNDYDDLIERTSTVNPFLFTLSNDTTGEAYGVEVSSFVQVTPRWELSAYYAFSKLRLDGTDEGAAEGTPENHAHIRSTYRVRDDLELHSAVYYVDHVSSPRIDAFIRTDAGVSWRPCEGVKVSLWGYNLADDRHLESVDPFRLATQSFVPRSFFVQASWDF